MGRIAKDYAIKFKRILEQFQARNPDAGVQRLPADASLLSERERISDADARLLEFRETFLKIQKGEGHREEQLAGEHGKLASAGMEYPVNPVPQSATGPRFLCDAGLGGLARRFRAAGYEAIWIPNIGDDAPLRETRRLDATILTTDSMLMERRWNTASCGTHRWLNEFYECVRCHKLFWHGTHRGKIPDGLKQALEMPVFTGVN